MVVSVDILLFCVEYVYLSRIIGTSKWDSFLVDHKYNSKTVIITNYYTSSKTHRTSLVQVFIYF